MKSEMLKNPYIENVSRGNSLPFWIGSNSGGFDWEGSDGNNDILIGFTFVDYDYDQIMGLNIKSGRFYDNQFATDTTKIVINEKLAGFISDEEVIGKWISWGDWEFSFLKDQSGQPGCSHRLYAGGVGEI